MGIKGLKPLLKANGVKEICVPISDLAGQRVAIDSAFMLHKYKNCSQDNWPATVMNMLKLFKAERIHAIFVFDGTAPPEKEKEKTLRQNRRQAAKDRATRLTVQLDDYVDSGSVGPDLASAVVRLFRAPPGQNRMLSGRLPKHMIVDQTARDVLSGSTDPAVRAAQPVTVQLRQYANKLLKDTKVYHEDYNLMKQMLTAMGFPIVHAPSEAELFCVRLVAEGYADTLISTDSDAIASGAVHNVDVIYTDIHRDTLQCISIKQALTKLAISKEQFLDLCVMCGTDFNQRIPRLGPMTALKMIKTFGSIENMACKYPVHTLDYARVREILIGDKPVKSPSPEKDVNSKLMEEVHKNTHFPSRSSGYVFKRPFHRPFIRPPPFLPKTPQIKGVVFEDD